MKNNIVKTTAQLRCFDCGVERVYDILPFPYTIDLNYMKCKECGKIGYLNYKESSYLMPGGGLVE
jgi:hypothetical protein